MDISVYLCKSNLIIIIRPILWFVRHSSHTSKEENPRFLRQAWTRPIVLTNHGYLSGYVYTNLISWNIPVVILVPQNIEQVRLASATVHSHLTVQSKSATVLRFLYIAMQYPSWALLCRLLIEDNDPKSKQSLIGNDLKSKSTSCRISTLVFHWFWNFKCILK